MRRSGPRRRPIAVIVDRLYLRLRHRDAWGATRDPTGTFTSLGGHEYCLLTTFRKSWEPVPTPVWFGLSDGRVYVRSEVEVGKVKRIRREPRVQLAPCTFRGRPLGPSISGRARILEPEDWKRAERAIASNYGWHRRFYEGTIGRVLYSRLLYIEITPVD